MSLDLEGARDVADETQAPENDTHDDRAGDRSGADEEGTVDSGCTNADTSVALSRRLRLTAVAALAVAVVYALACVVYNMPSSTMKVRANGADKAVMQPWFEQDWQLFAPTPATNNSHIVVSARGVAADGSATALAPFDIQYPIENKPKDDPVLPTKQPGITLAAQERFAAYQKQLVVIENAPRSAQRKLHDQLDATYRPTLDALDRLISYEAHQKYPDAHITQVRATFTQEAMTPFSERYVKNPPKQKTKTLLQTTWFPYVSGVAD